MLNYSRMQYLYNLQKLITIDSNAVVFAHVKLLNLQMNVELSICSCEFYKQQERIISQYTEQYISVFIMKNM